MRRCALVLLLATASAGAQDDPTSPVFDYLFLQGGYTFTAPTEDGPNAHGFGLGGSLPVGPQLFFTGDYSWSRTEPFTIAGISGRTLATAVSFGLGAYQSLTPCIDLTGSVSYINGTVRGKDGFGMAPTVHDDGIGLGTSLRYLLTRRLEAYGGPGFSRVGGDNAWDVGAGLIYRLTRQYSVGLASSLSEDSWGLGLNLRTSLPVEEENPADVAPRDEEPPVEQPSP